MKQALFLMLVFSAPAIALAQSSGQSLAATIEVYVFPAAGQDASQQSKDEASCYEWATGNTGTDPFALAKQEEVDRQQQQAEMEAAQQAGQGRGAQGAVRGAAAGALIGEVANDDAGKGAAWGAAAGAVRGRRVAHAERQEAEQQAASRAAEREAATAQQLANFKNAFAVCLEAKDYMVKY